MSTTIPSRLDESSEPGRAGVERSEAGGRARRCAGAARSPALGPELAEEVKALLPDEVIDALLAGARTEEEITGRGGLLSQLTKRVVERALEVELTDHLGFEPHQEPAGGTGNTRNGSTPKTLLTEHGEVGIETPRDRQGTFEPQIVRKRQRRFEGFDDKILALYTRGLSTRDIEAHLEEIYGVKVGRDLISRVTDAVMEDARASMKCSMAAISSGRRGRRRDGLAGWSGSRTRSRPCSSNANAVRVDTPRRQTSRSTTSTYGGVAASSVIALSSASLLAFASSMRL